MASNEATIWEPLSLHEITQRGGEQGLLDELTYQLDMIDYEPHVRDKIDHAVNLMRMVHEGQMRDDLPYTTHTLRVALRNIIHLQYTDPDTMIASLLHDSVEDRPGRYIDPFMPAEEAAQPAYRTVAFGRIRDEFGDNPRNIVEAVTNPILLPGEDKRKVYYKHIDEKVTPVLKARIVKLSDNLDNVKGLKYNTDPVAVLYFAGKYYPLLPTMLRLALLPDTPLTDAGREYAIQSIESAQRRCRMILRSA